MARLKFREREGSVPGRDMHCHRYTSKPGGIIAQPRSAYLPSEWIGWCPYSARAIPARYGLALVKLFMSTNRSLDSDVLMEIVRWRLLEKSPLLTNLLLSLSILLSSRLVVSKKAYIVQFFYLCVTIAAELYKCPAAFYCTDALTASSDEEVAQAARQVIPIAA